VGRLAAAGVLVAGRTGVDTCRGKCVGRGGTSAAPVGFAVAIDDFGVARVRGRPGTPTWSPSRYATK
jgi:hypothetical protein